MPAQLRLHFAALALSVTCIASCGTESAPTTHSSAGNSSTATAGQPGAASTSGAGPSAGASGASSSGGQAGSSVAGGSAGASNGGAGTGGGAGAGSGASGSGVASAGGSNGGAATGGASGWAFPAGVSKPRIMIVGDSISAGPGCYKKFLLKDLTDNHYSSFEFVGEYADDCGSTVRHGAVSCSTAEQFTQATFTMPNCSQGMSFPGMSTLVASHDPDLIMLQLGVNDVWNGKTVEAILANYATLLQQARAHNPRVAVVVARIQKIRPDCSSDDKVTKLAESLVSAVPAWAEGKSLPDSPVFVADLWTSSDWSKAETTDCVHPNDVGAEKMGMNWYNALKSILKPN